jgi:hypothetical protein
MIERFNFYDIYGYLLPGTLLFGLFWIPFGLTLGLPSKEISSTLLLLVLAYIAGHVLQTVALVVVPSRVRDPKGNLRAPSNILLDADDPKFNEDFKTDLTDKLKKAFNKKSLAEDSGRTDAFFQARAYLIRNKASSYVEQFEALYAMMRGLGCAFLVGFAYLAGWTVSFHWKVQGVGLAMWCVLAASIGGAIVATGVNKYIAEHPATDKDERKTLQERDLDATSFLALCGLLFAAGMGYFLGTWKPAPARMEFFLWTALPVAWIAAMRCLQAYRNFAESFAETVWRDFAGLYGDDSAPKPGDDPKKNGAHAA